MESVLTLHVRHFKTENDPASQVLPELTRLVRERLIRRNLISAPPSFLGFAGASWDSPEVLDDLVQTCYVEGILRHFPGLKVRADRGLSIEGLVRRNIDNCLGERQREHDPVGAAVYSNVCGAVQQLTPETWNVLELENGRVRPSTRVCLQSVRGDLVLERRALEVAVQQAPHWPEGLAVLVIPSDEGREWVVGFLRVLLSGAEGRGVRVAELSAALAQRARTDWSARFRPEDTTWDLELGQFVRLTSPDRRPDDEDHWRGIRSKMTQAIEHAVVQERVRIRLSEVWTALAETIEAGEIPRQAHLGRVLDIPRATLSDLYRTLKSMLSRTLEQENPDNRG